MARRPLVLVLLAGLVASVAACGIDEDVVAREAAEARPPETTTTEAPEREPEPEPATASPFSVGEVPDGYQLRVEGPGEQEPDETVRPVAVLAPDGEPSPGDVVLVEAVPATDDEPGFDAAAGGDWSSLTIPGLRAWGVDATEDDLREVLDATTAPTEPGTAPVVEDPPGDLQVVGRISAAGVVALRAVVPAGTEDEDADDGDADAEDDEERDEDDEPPVPGPTSAYTAAWATSGSSLVALTLPAGSLDPAAVVAEVEEPRRSVDEEREAEVRGVFVGDATGIVTTTTTAATDTVVRRELEVGTEWGDVLVLISRGDDILDAEELVAVAESVSRDR